MVVVVEVVVVRRKLYNTRVCPSVLTRCPRVRGGRTPGSQALGVPATSRPLDNQQQLVTEGLLLGPDVRMDGFRKLKQNAAKIPLRTHLKIVMELCR